MASLAALPSPIGRRHVEAFAERGGEIARGGKTDLFGDIPDAHRRIGKKALGGAQSRIAQIFEHRLPERVPEHAGQALLVRTDSLGERLERRRIAQVTQQDLAGRPDERSIRIVGKRGQVFVDAFAQHLLQMIPDARDHFRRFEWLDDVVHGTGLEPFDATIEIALGGQDDDRDGMRGRGGGQQPAGGEAVHAGHAHIHQDQVRGDRLGTVVRLQAIEGDADPASRDTQYLDQQLKLVRPVIHDQDMGAGDIRRGLQRRRTRQAR